MSNGISAAVMCYARHEISEAMSALQYTMKALWLTVFVISLGENFYHASADQNMTLIENISRIINITMMYMDSIQGDNSQKGNNQITSIDVDNTQGGNTQTDNSQTLDVYNESYQNGHNKGNDQVTNNHMGNKQSIHDHEGNNEMYTNQTDNNESINNQTGNNENINNQTSNNDNFNNQAYGVLSINSQMDNETDKNQTTQVDHMTSTALQNAASVQEEMDFEVLQVIETEIMQLPTIQDLFDAGIIYKDGKPMTAEDLAGMAGNYDNETGKHHISDVTTYPSNAGCAPREVVEEVKITLPDAYSIMHPACILVKRCSGCCSRNTKCVPLETSEKNYNMLLLKFDPEREETHIAAIRPIKIMQHTKCFCECTLNENSCGPRKYFSAQACSCQCKAEFRVRCTPPLLYNPETCACECSERQECCDKGSPCTLHFDDRICECVIRRKYISNTVPTGETGSIIDRPLLGRLKATPAPRTTPASTTATTSARAETTADIGPCPDVACPRSFLKKVNKDGRCVCTPTRVFRPYHNN